MAVPKAIRERLLTQMESLIDEGASILDTRERRRGEPMITDITGEQVIRRRDPYEVVDPVAMVSWATKCVNVLNAILPEKNPNRKILEEFQDYGKPQPHKVQYLVGRLQALHDDFAGGFLDDAWSMLEADIASDFLAQAETLLEEGYYVPAAVLAGAVLENALRRLCENHEHPIGTSMPNGRPKTLNVYIDDLRKVKVYNEARAKQLRAWAAIRNHAAHGQFREFVSNDVEQMLRGIRSFVTAACAEES